MMAATHRITRVSLTLGAVLGIVLSGGALLGQSSADIPPDPRKLVYPPLDYSPPDRAAHRHQLSPGVVAYLVEDHSLPLVNVQLVMKIGRYLDSPQQVGLAAAVGSLLRSGGTSRWPAEKFDEEADFLAANISSRVGQTSASARVNALSKDLDQALDLFFEMLRNPAFEQQRVDLYKSQLLQRLERRNDRTGSIERREWNRLLRGDEHFSNRFTTNSSAEAFTPENLRAFHQKHYVPANFILAVSGSFDTAEMKAKLAEHLAKWEQAGERSQAVPRPDHQPQPGLYLVHKEDVNQGRVSIGHLGIERKNPDRFAVSLMNQVLGGSGFTSRITNRVRSDEGLAYSAGSSFSAGDYYPGAFRAFFQSKSATCAEAAQIILDEIEQIRKEGVSEDELDTVKTLSIEIFPRFFASARAVASTFANDELLGREMDYWEGYRDKLRAVTLADVQRVARKYLQPGRLIILAVGNTEDMLKGNPDKPQYALEAFKGDGEVVRIPLPDPLTMVYPPAAPR